MTYGAFTQDYASYEYDGRARKPVPAAVLVGVALGLTASIGLWTLHSRSHPTAPDVPAPVLAVAPVQAPPHVLAAGSAPTGALSVAALPTKTSAPLAVRADVTAMPALRRDASLLDPRSTLGYGSISFARATALRAGLEPRPMVAPAPAPAPGPEKVAALPPQVVPQVPVVSEVVQSEAAKSEVVKSDVVQSEAVAPAAVPTQPEKDVPMPQPRPAGLSTVANAPVHEVTRVARAAVEVPATAPRAEQPGFFDKLFGKAGQNGPALAYAAPEDGVIGSGLGRPAPVDRYTAIYDISAHTVYLPDGTRLEAHSGLGAAKDNPRMVTQRMVGATPPNVYELKEREAIFHGVRALRMTPTGGTTYGRAGLLTHSYMLRGRSGESNGCVVFKDYQAFLRAYDAGQVRRLAVVASRS